MYFIYPNLTIKFLPLLSLAVILVYSINLKGAYQTDETRPLHLQMIDLEAEIWSFVEEEIQNSDNYNHFCSIAFHPFIVFYNDVFIPFLNEHDANYFNNTTQEHIDSLRLQFELTQYAWYNCMSHSENISDRSLLNSLVSRDNRSFIINKLREYGITEEALDTMRDFLEIQTTILSSDNIRCQRSIQVSHTNLITRYNLPAVLLTPREDRSQTIIDRKAEIDALKAEWENCTTPL